MALGIVVGASILVVRSVKGEAGFVPPQMHRAVYDLTLDHAKSASDVMGIEGRMVVEWRGGPACEGYTSDQRVVTSSTDASGGISVSDVRLNSWESLDGNEFRFDRAEYLDGKLAARERGTVRHLKGKVVLEEPEKGIQVLPSDVMFPSSFNLALMKAAQHGQTVFSHLLFDGTQTAATDVTAFIGTAGVMASDAGTVRIKNRNKGASLSGTKAWPVRMSYFDLGSGGRDGTPSFEMGFFMFPNGVMSKLSLDYDDVVLKGDLAEIEYFQPGAC